MIGPGGGDVVFDGCYLVFVFLLVQGMGMAGFMGVVVSVAFGVLVR